MTRRSGHELEQATCSLESHGSAAQFKDASVVLVVDCVGSVIPKHVEAGNRAVGDGMLKEACDK